MGITPAAAAGPTFCDMADGGLQGSYFPVMRGGAVPALHRGSAWSGLVDKAGHEQHRLQLFLAGQPRVPRLKRPLRMVWTTTERFSVR